MGVVSRNTREMKVQQKRKRLLAEPLTFAFEKP
jgi:hypothetical protein